MLITGMSLFVIGLLLFEKNLAPKLWASRNVPVVDQRVSRQSLRDSLAEDNLEAAAESHLAKEMEAYLERDLRISSIWPLKSHIDPSEVLSRPKNIFAIVVNSDGQIEVSVRQTTDGALIRSTSLEQIRSYVSIINQMLIEHQNNETVTINEEDIGGYYEKVVHEPINPREDSGLL